MKNQLRVFVGSAIIILGLSLPTVVPKLENMIVPSEPSVRQVMAIGKPSPEMITFAAPIDKFITDKKDKESFAVFNKEFSDRVDKYKTKGQAVLGIYETSVDAVFGVKLHDSYSGKVGELIESTMTGVMSDYDTELTDAQREQLKTKFAAFAWVLGGDKDE